MSLRPFLALAAAECLSISGSRLAGIAIPWLVLTTTGSPVLTGIVAMAEMLPAVVSRALGGPLIDRIGAHRVAIVGDLLSVLVIALVPILHALGALEVWLLLPIVFLLGLLRGPTDAAKLVLIPQVARLAGLPLERVTGVVGVIERLGSVVGAGLAGALVAVIGPAEALLVNVAAFSLSALIVALGIPPVAAATRAVTGYLADLREGWRFLRSDAVLVGIVLMLSVTNLLDQAYFVVLVPVWVEAGGQGADLLGLVFATFAAASIAGAAIATLFGERLPRLPVYVLAFLLTGLPRYLAFALGFPPAWVFGVVALAGIASGFLNPILGAVIFERIPPALRGRVSSLSTALGFSLMPFGGVLAGLLIAPFGVAAAFGICGAIYLGATLLPLLRPSFRAFADRPEPGPG